LLFEDGMISSLPTNMHIHWLRQEILANDLANASTAGFKRDGLSIAGQPVPPAEPTFAMLGMTPNDHYTVTQWTDYSPGVIRDTDRPLDIAIDGSGFFVVQTPRGLRYTRAGGLTVDRAGLLTTAAGYPIMGGGGPISVTSTRVNFASTGEIQADGQIIDTIRVVDFPRPYRLQKEGDGLFVPLGPAAPPAAASDYQIVGGAIEGSNADPVRSMVAMIDLFRSYESAQRAIQSADETERRANDIGRV
jgi:flagellar basal-body rod protein FlgG